MAQPRRDGARGGNLHLVGAEEEDRDPLPVATVRLADLLAHAHAHAQASVAQSSSGHDMSARARARALTLAGQCGKPFILANTRSPAPRPAPAPALLGIPGSLQQPD